MWIDKRPAQRQRAGDLAADPELWHALHEGRLLRTILETFYDLVYQDERLSPFFRSVSKEHAVGKQYSFMMDRITGERVYFGMRPRNAHHWMVISDELFDYRETLLLKCMRQHGLADEFCQRWHRFDEVFRKQIVKAEPVSKKIGGIALPLEGYMELQLAIGTICDGCASVLDEGAPAMSHVRTGRTFCLGCHRHEIDGSKDREKHS